MIYNRTLSRFAAALRPPLRPVVIDGQRLDPDTQWLIRLGELGGAPTVSAPTVAEARARFRQSATFLDPRVSGCQSAERTLPGPAGELRARLYSPRGASQRAPGLLFLHGGGWTIGDLDTHDNVCRYLAVEAGCRVLALDYRLAPEHPYPAAVEDAEAALAWLLGHAAEVGVDPARVAVGGDSAGGNLATVVARRARDAGSGGPCYQLLLYPGVDATQERPSFQLFGEGFLLTGADVRWFKGHYHPDPSRMGEPDASPLLTEDLSGLPPAAVIVAGFDPLRDEGLAYARRLAEAGVPTAEVLHEGLIHGFPHVSAASRASREALAAAAASLRAGLAR